MSEEKKLYFGKYRGTVADNTDPLMLGRIQAYVPAVLEDRSKLVGLHPAHLTPETEWDSSSYHL